MSREPGLDLRDRGCARCRLLLLLHGGPGADHTVFKPAYSQLADVVQVVLFRPSRRWPQRRSRRHRAVETAQWGDDVKALCDALEIERPIVMGVSFGGYVAILRIAHPDHPAKLILCSTAASPSERGDPGRNLRKARRSGGWCSSAEPFLRNSTREATRAFRRLCGPLYSRSPYDPDINARTIWNPRLMAASFAAAKERP